VSAKALKISQESYKLIGATLADSDCDVIQTNPNIDISTPEKKKFFYLMMGFKLKVKKVSVKTSQNRKVTAKSF